MDFSGVTNDVSARTLDAVRRILAMGMSPDDTAAALARLFAEIGAKYHDQLYGATSYVLDSAAISSSGATDVNDQAGRLARKIVRNAALSRDTAGELVGTFYTSMLAQAQNEAFVNAQSMQKHPTLTRSIVGETCKWCDNLAGVYVDPPHDAFKRHSGCDCKLEVSGYRSRNGSVQNYIKKRGK